MNDLFTSMDSSKEKASSFCNSLIQEVFDIKTEIEKIKVRSQKIHKSIHKVTKLSNQYRKELIIISKNKRPNKDELKYQEAYKKAEDTLFTLRNLEKESKILFKRRNILDRRLVDTKSLLSEAEDLMNMIGTSIKYLSTNIKDIGIELEKKDEVLFKIIESSEFEKKRISRDIHDGPAQTLTHLKIEMQLLRMLIEDKEQDSALKEIESIEKHLKYAIGEIRGIMYDLRPMSLDDLGIIPTLKNYIKEFNQDKNMNITLEIKDTFKLSNRIPDALKLVIFRIVQETVNNAYKHSEVKGVLVHLEIQKHKINIKIIDGGRGFDVEKTLTCRDSKRFGLIGMRERVDLVDGKIAIMSKPGSGTRVHVNIPWKPYK